MKKRKQTKRKNFDKYWEITDFIGELQQQGYTYRAIAAILKYHGYKNIYGEDFTAEAVRKRHVAHFRSEERIIEDALKIRHDCDARIIRTVRRAPDPDNVLFMLQEKNREEVEKLLGVFKEERPSAGTEDPSEN
ncbi:hypothetical protein ACFL2Q_14695 [Thermodesulfobacteriota bacterium]